MFEQCVFLIRRLGQARSKLDAALADAPEGKFLYKDWMIKELMAHIAGWDDVIIEAIKTHSVNQPITPTVARGVNAYNAQTVTSRESLDLEQTRREFQATRAALVQALKDMPDEKFNQPLIFPWGEDGTVAYLIDIFVEHEEYHANHIQEWKKNPDEIIGEH